MIHISKNQIYPTNLPIGTISSQIGWAALVPSLVLGLLDSMTKWWTCEYLQFWCPSLFRYVSAGGIFHGGIEVFGEEWSYGYTTRESGMYMCQPKDNPMYTYRESISLGKTNLSKYEVISTSWLAFLDTAWSFSSFKHICVDNGMTAPEGWLLQDLRIQALDWHYQTLSLVLQLRRNIECDDVLENSSKHAFINLLLLLLNATRFLNVNWNWPHFLMDFPVYTSRIWDGHYIVNFFWQSSLLYSPCITILHAEKAKYSPGPDTNENFCLQFLGLQHLCECPGLTDTWIHENVLAWDSLWHNIS